jgi:uncharacterized protein YndB with AHSA1/START domain
MKNFDWTSFKKKIAVNAPLKTIYDAWTVPGELEKWFLKTARFFDEKGTPVRMNSNVVPSNKYEMTWYLYEELEKGVITKANEKDLLEFTFAGNCMVSITLSEQFGHTMVELEQTDIPTDDDSKLNIRLGCSSGWSFYLVNLKSVYEGGLDLRSKDERLKPMVNN